MPAIDRLPTEIAELIAEHLYNRHSNADLRSLRLSDRRFCIASTKALFRAVKVEICLAHDRYDAYPEDSMWSPFTSQDSSFHTGDAPLANLANIATQPHLAIHVQHLILGSGHIHLDELSEYKRTLLPLKTDRFHNVFTNRVDGPIRRHTVAVESALTAALPALPNLIDVTICNHNNQFATMHNAQLGAATRSLLTHFSQASPTRQLRKWTHFAQDMGAIISYSSALASALAKTSLFRFYIYANLGPSVPGMITLDTLLADAIRGIRFLKAFEMNCTRDKHWPDLQRSVLVLQNVEMAHLAMSRFSLRGLPPATIDPIPQVSSQHPRTRITLAFHHASISSAWLSHLLTSSSQTLTKIRLERIFLTSGTWGEIFSFMTHNLPKLRVLKLKKVQYARTGDSKRLRPLNGVNDPIIIGRGGENMLSRELSDFGFLEELLEVVDTRSGRLVRDGNADSDRPVFGPREQMCATWDGTAPFRAKEGEGMIREVQRDDLV